MTSLICCAIFQMFFNVFVVRYSVFYIKYLFYWTSTEQWFIPNLIPQLYSMPMSTYTCKHCSVHDMHTTLYPCYVQNGIFQHSEHQRTYFSIFPLQYKLNCSFDTHVSLKFREACCNTTGSHPYVLLVKHEIQWGYVIWPLGKLSLPQEDVVA